MALNGKLTAFLPFGLVLLAGCPPASDDKDTPVDTDTGEPADTDTGDTNDTDTGEPDTGETGTVEPVFGAFTDEADLLEVTDVATAGDAGVYVAGFNLAGEAGIWWIPADASAATQVYVGVPLVQPTGIGVSDDGSTVYVSDLGVPSTTGAMNGAVYSIPSGGGALTEQGADDVIDLPGDVTPAHGGSGLYVSGFTADGTAAIFALSGGAATVATSGGGLADPTAISVSPDGSWMFVIDSLAADGRAAVLRYELPGFTAGELASGFQVAFPGGVGSDDVSVYYTTVGDPGLYQMAHDGSAVTVTDTLGLMELPAGVGVGSGRVYVSELASDVGADLYLLSY